MFTSAVFASANIVLLCYTPPASKYLRFNNPLTNFASVKDNLLAGFALMLVFEGILPFMAPRAWRETFRRVIELSDGQLRFIGLASIGLGLLILFMVT
jgi:uncharacterized protein YjeT (DUF2065 family)